MPFTNEVVLLTGLERLKPQHRFQAEILHNDHSVIPVLLVQTMASHISSRLQITCPFHCKVGTRCSRWALLYRLISRGQQMSP